MKFWWAFLVAVALGASMARAQAGANAQAQAGAERFQRQMDQIQQDSRVLVNQDLPPGQRVFLDYGAYLSVNYLSLDDATGNNHGVKEVDGVVYGLLNLDGVQQFFIRGREAYRDFNSGDAFDNRGSFQHSYLDQAFYRFDLQRYLNGYEHRSVDYDVAFQVGRQTVAWANGLTFDQDIDGAVIDVRCGQTALEAIGGVTIPETIDFDASRPGFDQHTTRGFFGAILSSQFGQCRPFVYGLIQRDYNPPTTLTVPFGGGTDTTMFHYDSWYVGTGATGGFADHFTYGVEGVFEGGNGLSSSFIPPATTVPQTMEKILAWAGDARLTYLPNDERHSRLESELIVASGDHDRLNSSTTFGGNMTGTSDLAFNGFGLLNTGVAFNPTVSNLLLLRLGASTYPAPNSPLLRHLQVGVDVFLFDKLMMRAPIDEPTSAGRYLGWEPDVYVNWQLTSDVAVTARYGIFFPGHKILTSQSDRNALYTGVTYAF